MNNPQSKIARGLSIVGHPFLLMPVLTGIIAYHVLPPSQALIVEIVALGVVIIPSALYTLLRVRNGTWNDLDVSNQQHRGEFYGILLPLLCIITIVAVFADVPAAIPLGSLAIITLVILAFAVNSWMKVSLHTGFAIFVALTLFFIMPGIATIALILACAVAWSRVVLGRHTPGEVLAGAGLGLAVAAAFAFTLRYFN